MAKIFITGDTHGAIDISKLSFFEYADMDITKDDILIVAGDFGVPWSNPADMLDGALINFYDSLPLTTMFIDGNHDNFIALKKLPTCEKFGVTCGAVSESIYHIRRGEVLDVAGGILCIGGANSVDKLARTPYVSWWPDEEITEEDIDKATKAIAMHQPSVVISHDAPYSVLKTLYGKGNAFQTNSSKALETLYQYIKENNTSITDWYFGHHHVNRTLTDDRITFHAMYNSIEMISA